MAELAFSSHMLDGFDLLYKRTDEVLKSTQEFGNFLKKVSTVETEYAKALSKVAQVKKNSTTNVERGTVKESWDVIHSELEQIAAKHQEFSNHLGEMFVSVSNSVKERTNTRRKLVQSGTQLTTDLASMMASLKKAKGNYESKCKAADSAQQQYQKAKTDGNIKPKEVNKLNSKAQKALEASNIADKEYKKALSKANEKQRKFYEKEMPELLLEFQRFEEDRINFIKEILESYSRLQNEFPGFLDERGKAINAVVSAVNTAADIQLFLQQNQTNISPPADIEYEPYQSENPGFQAAQSSAGVGGGPSSSTSSAPGIMGARGSTLSEAPKEYGLTEQDESLGVEEKMAKLQAQLAELREAIKAETKSKKGLEKLVKFYASDPTAQDKAKGELEEQKRKIANMKETRQQLEAQLAELCGGTDGQEEQAYDESYDYQQEGGDGEPEEFASEDVCQARALYDYEATNDTELSFAEGDILTVTERDDSGWWFAELNGQTGFVPNNYVSVIES